MPTRRRSSRERSQARVSRPLQFIYGDPGGQFVILVYVRTQKNSAVPILRREGAFSFGMDGERSSDHVSFLAGKALRTHGGRPLLENIGNPRIRYIIVTLSLIVPWVSFCYIAYTTW